MIRALAIALALSLAFGGWQTRTIYVMRAEAAAAALVAKEGERIAEIAQAAKYRAQTVALQRVTDAKDAELRRVRAAADAELDGLRNRPERPAELPGGGVAASACADATGAGLSRPDAGFLVRFAALAAATRGELAACEARETAIRGRVTEAQK